MSNNEKDCKDFKKDQCPTTCKWIDASKLKNKIVKKEKLGAQVKENGGLCFDQNTDKCGLIQDPATCNSLEGDCIFDTKKNKCNPFPVGPEAVKSDDKDYDNYESQLGACRPSAKRGKDAWKNRGYKTIDQCKMDCDNDSNCRAFDVARPKDGKYHCFLHYNKSEELGGNPNVGGCNFKDDCSCYVKVDPKEVKREDESYRTEMGACRPSNNIGQNPWKDMGYKMVDECKTDCNNDPKCKGFDVARPIDGKYHCFLHYNENMKGDPTIPNCQAKDDCTCHLKVSSSAPSASSSAPATGCIRLFEHMKQYGYSTNKILDFCGEAANVGELEGKVSDYTIGPKTCVTFYDLPGFQNQLEEICNEGDTPMEGTSRFNDRTSSLKIRSMSGSKSGSTGLGRMGSTSEPRPPLASNPSKVLLMPISKDVEIQNNAFKSATPGCIRVLDKDSGDGIDYIREFCGDFESKNGSLAKSNSFYLGPKTCAYMYDSASYTNEIDKICNNSNDAKLFTDRPFSPNVKGMRIFQI